VVGVYREGSYNVLTKEVHGENLKKEKRCKETVKGS